MTSLILMTVCLLDSTRLPQVVRHDSQHVVVENKAVSLSIDLQPGRFDLKWGSHASILGATGEIRFKNGPLVTTADYPQHEVRKTDVQEVKDALGSGIKIVLRHSKPGEPQLNQVFWIYDDRPEAIVRLAASAEHTVESNYIAPVVAKGEPSSIKFSGKDMCSLFVPFDNDDYVRYRSDNWGENSESCEVGAVYDNTSRGGLVVGSIDHDIWKTGVQVRKSESQPISSLKVYAGATNRWTHDHEPHGFVSGKTIQSPRMILGQYGDWRDGMERYADVNALVSPALPWDGDVPFGWNSWSGHKDKLKASDAQAATDFIAKQVPGFRNDGVAYVNLDSYWDNMKEGELEAFVKNAHAAGLKAGIYWSPFTCWGELDWKVDGKDGKFIYRQLAITESKGQPLPKLDGGWPLDPTHPQTLARNRKYYEMFVKLGFDFVKLDFLSHGSLEGNYHDPKITTGIAAYRKGMQDMVDIFSPKKIGRPFFVSLSIAPLFPQGYGHSRRSSCDVFARIDQTEYMLNSATYGWWTHGRVYKFNDPDHTVVYREHGQKVVSEEEGRSRLTASVIGGGMLLQGDDLTDPLAEDRVRTLFSNQEVLDVARKGLAFRPVEGNTPEQAASAFVWQDVSSKKTYLALFNYDPAKKATRQVALERIGLDPKKTYRVRSLWTGEKTNQAGLVSVDLAAAGCALLELEPEA
jgi:alpha-galactosidase